MKLRYYILFAVSALMLIFSIVTPLGTDVTVSFGAAIQADYLGKFPYNVYDSWNLRGIGYKYLIYLIYRIGLMFSTPGSPSFEIWAKMIYYAIFLPISYLSFKLLKPSFVKLKIYWVDAFIIFLISVLSFSWNFPMQPEDASVYLTVAMTAFALSSHKRLNYLSGVFIPLLLSLKLVTIAFAFFPTMILLSTLKTEKELIKRYIISCIGFLIFTVLFYLFVIPLEIKDTYKATLFQSSFHLNFKSISSLGLWFIKSFSDSAYLFAGTICGLILIYRSRSNFRLFFFMVLLFAVPAFEVLVQNRFSVYQYLIFFPASMISIFVLLSENKDPKSYLRNFGIVAGSITVLWVLCVVLDLKIPVKDSKSSNSWYINTIFNPQRNAFNEMNIKYHLSEQKEMLYLTGGYPNFFIPNKSYLRYFYPLPLKRVTENPKLKETSLFKEVLAQSLTYKGDYILLQPNWFDLNNTLPLKEKIQQEYELVDQKSFPDYSEALLDLYKRKNEPK